MYDYVLSWFMWHLGSHPWSVCPKPGMCSLARIIGRRPATRCTEEWCEDVCMFRVYIHIQEMYSDVHNMIPHAFTIQL